MSNVKEAERPKGGRQRGLQVGAMAFCISSHAVPIEKGALISDSSSIPLPLPPHKAASVALGLRSSQGRQARTDALCYRSESPRFVCVYHFCQWTITDSTFTLLPEISQKTKKRTTYRIHAGCLRGQFGLFLTLITNWRTGLTDLSSLRWSGSITQRWRYPSNTNYIVLCNCFLSTICPLIRDPSPFL